MSDAVEHVELTGAVSGHYVIRDRRPDGEIVLAPDTSWRAIADRVGGRELTPEEWESFNQEHVPHMLPADGEG